MFRCECCTTYTDSILDASLIESDGIHLSFDDIDFATFRDKLLGKVEAIEDRAFIEYMRSWGVQIFRKGSIEDTPSECDDMTHTIGYWKGNPSEKLIPSFTEKYP